ncbi:MAG: Mbeg1-like protein [Clostridia bacterium]
MSDLFEYIKWRGDLTLAHTPFNEVDSLILCRLSYLPWDGIVPASFKSPISIADAAEKCLSLLGADGDGRKVHLKADELLLRELAQSERFGAMYLAGYTNIVDIAEQKQFSAISIIVSGAAYIAFRGTDGTLVGWKEDFNMSFESAVPAQLAAVDYLTAAAGAIRGQLRVGGHSKGGNLAVYAAAFCKPSIQRRIVDVYNNDGPGFSAEVLKAPGFSIIDSKVHTFVPQSSVVGMLLEHDEDFVAVHSTQKGLMQHDIYSWDVTHNALVYVSGVTRSSQFIDITLKDWLTGMQPELRQKLIDAAYDILASSDATTLSELFKGKNTMAILKSLTNIDDTTRKLLGQAMDILVSSIKKTTPLALDKLFKRQSDAPIMLES